MFASWAELEKAAVRFFAGGRGRGEKPVFVSAAGREAALREAERLAAAAGQAVLGVAGSAVYGSACFDPVGAAGAYGGMVEQARREGFSGVCVVADGTPLAARDWRAFARWESDADAAIDGGWCLSALCAYKPSALPPLVHQAMAALHPASALEPSFRLHHQGGRRMLSGDIDSTGADLLEQLAVATVAGEGPVVEIDASGLTFIDLAGLRALERAAGRLATRIKLTRAPDFLRDVLDCLRPLDLHSPVSAG